VTAPFISEQLSVAAGSDDYLAPPRDFELTVELATDRSPGRTDDLERSASAPDVSVVA
jgi:hypothetical protein